MNRIELHWLCNSPSPYNTDLFRALANDPQIELTVHYLKKSVKSHPWSSGLTDGYDCREISLIFGIDSYLLRLAAAGSSTSDTLRVFVISGWNHPVYITLTIALIFFSGNYVVWTDTPDRKQKHSFPVSELRYIWLSWMFNNSLKVMGTGEPALRVLQQMGAPAEKLINFPYWIDVSRYPVKYYSGQDTEAGSVPLRLISTGRIENSLKGHDIAIKALAKLNNQNTADFEYKIAGTGSDENELRFLAQDLGIGDKVKFLGWLEPVQLMRELADSDVLVHPSPVHEPYGVAVIEAMACGLVVLASDKTFAALDRIENGVNGFIHKAGDVSELSVQIGKLLNDRKLLHETGRKARLTAEQWPLEKAVSLVKEFMDSL